MACEHPIPSSRITEGKKKGQIALWVWRAPGDPRGLLLPCNKCDLCKKAYAKTWCLRALHELTQHQYAVFTTLTYEEKYLPPTLRKRDLQLFLKRLRRSTTDRPIRFLACGEYGDKRKRPHYHAILYGLAQVDAPAIHKAWGKGNTRTSRAGPQRIAYTAGYMQKKWERPTKKPVEKVDPTTGEVYTYQPPFLQMSRGGRHGHGLGGHQRQHSESWKLYAIHEGKKQKTPRYYYEAWKKQATPDQLEANRLIQQQYQQKKQKTEYEIQALKKINQKQQDHQASRRRAL